MTTGLACNRYHSADASLSVGTLRTGYPAYKHHVKTMAPASRLGVALRPPCVSVALALAPSLG
jgi:hypothetical protein